MRPGGRRLGRRPAYTHCTLQTRSNSTNQPEHPEPTPTPEPNRAPVVDTQAENYARFTFMGNRYTGNAPQGVLVSKPFHGIFSDPDGDELTYSVSVPDEYRQLVEELVVTLDKDYRESGGTRGPIGLYDRVFFRLDPDVDWKAVAPALPDPMITRVTLTATDPGGLSASVEGGFRTDWASEPALLSATSRGDAIELIFDIELQDSPKPRAVQFTVNVVDGDGTEGTVAVSSVSVSGKVVTLELASVLAKGQAVTVDYDYHDDTPLQRDGGGDHAPSFTGQAVVVPPGEPGNFAVSATQGSLDLSATWDTLDGATSYKLAWRQADGNFEAGNAANVTATSATITVEDYGQWVVRLEGCNDAGCGPSITQQVEVEPPPNRAPVVNAQAERYASFVGRQSAPRGSPVSKPFEGIFSDPDGDELTYAVSVPGDRSGLLDTLGAYEATNRVGILVDADDDWKAVSPALPDPLTITVTLTATDPDGLMASVSGDFVTDWESHPALVSAVANGQAVRLTFDQAVKDTPAPASGQFTVNVVNEDGSSGTIAVSSVSVSEKVVTLELASALADGQTVTLDYAHDDDVPLKRAADGGDNAPGFTGQAVVVPPGEPGNFAVSATQGSLDLLATWDALDGATSYKLAWRQADGDFESGNAANVTATSATITVEDYGQWVVRLEGCNDAGCGPSITQQVEVEPPELQVAATASPRTNFVAPDTVTLRTVISNAPSGSGSPSYRWEIAEDGGDWRSFISVSAFAYVMVHAGSRSFRVTVSYGSGDSATSDPITVTWAKNPNNRPPVVNEQAENYASFVGKRSAPRGSPGSKPFDGIFSDPDAVDRLTYAISVPDDQKDLVQTLGAYVATKRVGILVDDDDDWKAVSPALPDPLTITVTLTAIDLNGGSASVSGDFVTDWESHPALVSAVASEQAIVLTFDQAVQANPAPGPASSR